MSTFNPYLHFNGNAEAAFLFYKSIFGGEFDMFSRYKDVPPGTPIPEGTDVDSIMHVSLPVGNSALLGSDIPPAFGLGTRGNMHKISVQLDSKDAALRIFQGLSEGGKISMPIEDTFWGAYFGMVEDKFGVEWMINYTYPTA